MSWIGPGCLLFSGTFSWILGLLSISLWVGCYFECPSGRDVDFNYYVAVWTGVVAFLAGLFHMVFCCGKRRQYSKCMLWSAAVFSFLLLPCSLMLTTLSGYLSWREWDTEQRYQEDLADPDVNPDKLQGDYVTGIALFATMCVVGVFLLILTLVFNCYHCCGNSEVDEEEIEISVEPTIHEENPHGGSKSKDTYHPDYYNPPPPTYARGSNTHSGTVYNANYNDKRRTNDTHGNHSDHVRNHSSGGTQYSRTAGTHYSRSEGTQYSRSADTRHSHSAGTHYSRSAGTQSSRPAGTQSSRPIGTQSSRPAGTQYSRAAGTQSSQPGGTRYNRAGGTQYSRSSDHARYDSRSRPAPSYSHPPANNYHSSPSGRGGGYAFNSHPGRMRWEESSSQQVPRENPWTFGSGEDIIGSTRPHHSNYF